MMLLLLLLLEHLLLHMSGRWWWRRCGFAMFWRCILLATIVVHRCSMLHQHIQTLLSGRSPFSGCSYGWMKERKSKQNKLSSLVSYILWWFESLSALTSSWTDGFVAWERQSDCAHAQLILLVSKLNLPRLVDFLLHHLWAICRICQVIILHHDWAATAPQRGGHVMLQNVMVLHHHHRVNLDQLLGLGPAKKKTRELCIINEYVWVSLGGWLWY